MNLDETIKVVPDEKVKELLSKGSQMTRKDIIEVNKILTKSEPKDEVAKNFQFNVKKYLIDLDDRCVDVNWLEDVHDIKTPPTFCTKAIN